MAVMARETWTDHRLDDFRESVNQRFDALDKKVDNGFKEMRQDSRELRAEVIATNRHINQLTYGLIGTMLVGFLGTIVAVVTQM
ncbi:MAG: hypothetical protein ACTHN3_08865 [Solirubrobacterales bacterium]